MVPLVFATIAICTYNRADVLARSLDAARAQGFARDGFEILLVDNNSTDGTAAVAEAFRGRCDVAFRVVKETQQGLSRARNRAIAEAAGDWIVFVDDDAEMVPGFLAAMAEVVAAEPQAGAVGGPIDVGWLAPVPAWYEPRMDHSFNHLYHGSYRRAIRYPEILYGTNMAFPTALLRELGGFAPDLGRNGESLLACEDGEILLRIARKAKRAVVYDPELRVKHLIHPGRLTPEYLRKKAWWGGRSTAFLEKRYPGTANPLGSVMAVLQVTFHRVLKPGSRSLAQRNKLAFHLGYLKEYFLS